MTDNEAEVTKSRKWYWIAVSAFCALGLGVAFLSRPEDELAGLMRFHPAVSRLGMTEVYAFVSPPSAVLAAVPGQRGIIDMGVTDIELPSGRDALFVAGDSGQAEQTCRLIVSIDDRPWYEQAWSRIKGRLGL